jgi:hypothetical protein
MARGGVTGNRHGGEESRQMAIESGRFAIDLHRKGGSADRIGRAEKDRRRSRGRPAATNQQNEERSAPD